MPALWLLACGEGAPAPATATDAGGAGGAASAGTAAVGGAGKVVGGASGSSAQPTGGSDSGTAGASGGAGGATMNGAAGAAGGAGNAMAGSGTAGTGGTPNAGAAKLLCVGDSITEQEASWIFPMQDTLRGKSCKYELIGLDEGPYNGPYFVKPGYDSKRIAAGGFSTSGILNWIKEKGLGGVPDVVVEYLGVNNEYGGFIDGKYNPDNSADPDGSFIKDNKELFALVRAKNPSVTFVLMKIENHALPDIDAAIDQLVATESTAISPVVAVAAAENVETKDGIHPTAAGATILAGPVGQALLTLLSKQGRCAP